MQITHEQVPPDSTSVATTQATSQSMEAGLFDQDSSSQSLVEGACIYSAESRIIQTSKTQQDAEYIAEDRDKPIEVRWIFRTSVIFWVVSRIICMVLLWHHLRGNSHACKTRRRIQKMSTLSRLVGREFAIQHSLRALPFFPMETTKLRGTVSSTTKQRK